MEISVIASGSNGNCCLIEKGNTKILIDAGKSMKEIEYRANKLNKSLENLNAIFLTHSHSDHTRGIGPIARKYDVPVYLTKETFSRSISMLGKIKPIFFNLNEKVKLNSLTINPVKTSHDVPSCGFTINRFGYFTDTGCITNEMKDSVRALKGILLESNHDIDMLLNGFYPAFLKNRIMSDDGHLNNFDASKFINDHGKHLDFALLSHLSENNNKVELVKESFETIVNKKIDYDIMSRHKESGTWEL